MKSLPLKSAGPKTSYREVTAPPLLEQQGKSSAWVALTCLLFFFLFFPFFSRPSGLPEHQRVMLNSSHNSYLSYLCAFYKFGHLQVPDDTKMALYAISQEMGLAGYQNIVERYLIAHIAHVYGLHINSTIYKYQMILEMTLLKPRL